MVKHPRRHTWTRVVKVFDYFSGCGGTSKGLENAGMEIVFALDSDIDAIASYRKNFPKAVTHCGDIGKFKIEGVADLVNSSRRVPLLFTACAPCQPFTKLNHFQPESDPRRSLLDSFRDQVEHYMPDYVFLENVPGIQKSKNSDNPVSRLIELLDRMKYRHDAQVVLAQDYGVPQHRRRFILVASKHAPISIPNPTHGTSKDLKPFSTVQDFISELPGIEAGETHTEIPLHKSASLSDLNLQRIKATPEGGSRLDRLDHLVFNCHNNAHRGHTDVYERIRGIGHLPHSRLVASVCPMVGMVTPPKIEPLASWKQPCSKHSPKIIYLKVQWSQRHDRLAMQCRSNLQKFLAECS